jgi:hypothetical protein
MFAISIFLCVHYPVSFIVAVADHRIALFDNPVTLRAITCSWKATENPNVERLPLDLVDDFGFPMSSQTPDADFTSPDTMNVADWSA